MSIQIKGVQTGISTIANTTATVNATISAVDTAKSIIIATWTTDTTAPGKASVMWHFASTTSITFDIVSVSTATVGVDIHWTVIEYTAGSNIAIQHLTAAAPTGGGTVTINTVELANAYVISSWTNAGNAFGGDDTIFPEITSTTAITYRETTNSVDNLYMQIVYSTDISVQFVSAINTVNGGPIDITISAITLARSFPVSYWNITVDATIPFNNAVSAEFASTTVLRYFRNAIVAINIYAYVVQLPVNFKTQWAGVGVGAASNAAAITYAAVNTLWTYAFAGSAPFNTMARTTDTSSHYGAACFTTTLTSSTNLALARVNNGGFGGNFNCWLIENIGNWFLLQSNNELYNTMNTDLNN